MNSAPSAETETIRRFEPRGGNAELFRARDREILIEGPAGTGKTRAVLEMIHRICLSMRARVLIVRKASVTLTFHCARQ